MDVKSYLLTTMQGLHDRLIIKQLFKPFLYFFTFKQIEGDSNNINSNNNNLSSVNNCYKRTMSAGYGIEICASQ